MYVILLSCSFFYFFRSSLILFCALSVFFVSAHIIECVWTHIFCLVGRYVTGMIADMPSHIRTLFLFLGSVRILSCFASSSHHSDSFSIHSCLRSYRREYNKGTSLIDTSHRYRQPKYHFTEVTDTLKDSIFKNLIYRM